MTLKQQLQEDRNGLLRHLKALVETGQFEKVWKIAETMMYENPDDAAALFYAGTALNNMGHEETAYELLGRAANLRPDKADIWQNLGHVSDRLYRYDEALYCYERADELQPGDYQNYASMSSAYTGLGLSEMALAYADKALKLNPDSEIAQVNKGFAHLAMKQWPEGWAGYEKMLGHKSRRRKATAYTTPPKFWDGKTNENVVIYGEQGLGDEIMFASMINDAKIHTKHIIIDCHSKLEGLFARSFPDCSVYGTRHEEAPFWMAHEDVDSSIAVGSLGKYYRTKSEYFPKVPFLIADPDRKRMYRALLDGYQGKLKVGISWMGGNTHGGLRKLELDRLKDLVESFPEVDWISLQYLETPDYGLPIKTLKYATETEDYDDTAALVDELDLVISVPQAVVHLAGGLGKETWCLVPDVHRWIYAGYEHSWYGSVKLYKGWDTVMDRVKQDLKAKLERKEWKQSAKAIAS